MTTIHQAVQKLKDEGETPEGIYRRLCAGHDMADLLDALRSAGFDVRPLIQQLKGCDRPPADGTM